MNRKHIAVYPIAVLLLLAAACSNQSGQPSDANENEKPTASVPVESGLKPLAPGETWDVYMMLGKRIGYGRTTVRKVTGPGGETILSENEIHLKILRSGDVSEQAISIAALETPMGKLVSYQFDMQMGPGVIRSVGKVEGDKMVIETTGPGSPAPVKTILPWSPCYLGPFAVERSLLHHPMKPGETREMKAIMPEANKIGDITLAADIYDTTEMLNGSQRLFRVEMIVNYPQGGIEQKMILWCDRSGDILKRSVKLNEQLTLVSYRVDKAEALRKSDAAELDLMPSMAVKVDRPINNPHQTKRARYRVILKGGNPAESFPVGPTQSVEPIDPHTAEITVHAIRPSEKGGNQNATAEKPTEADLASNIYIQSDDRLIQANAEKAAGGEADPWQVAVALQRFVNREIKNVNYSQAFATAAEVARSGEGDCTEHAVYLAALCRARGIPARVAIGLVYMEGAQAFGFHAWTEVFIDGRWTPIDATLNQEGIGAAHLKIGSSNLKDASIAVALEPVLKLIGGLRIEVLETTPGE